ncbi:MAG: hypothetical protein IJX12_04555 [Lachnospiraceae bacterium]|nr:hypothetical protein [Lachnospiraceae bacterium]
MANDKLIIKYSIFCKKTAKRNKKFKEMLNYREQIDFLFGDSMSESEREKIISVLEKAGFSNTDISSEEYEYVINQINSVKVVTT